MNLHSVKPPFFIELLTRDKHLKTRHRFEQLPIRIGRSYENDLIIDDPYVAANHAIVELSDDEQLIIRDLESENGIVSEGKKQRQVVLENNVIRLGHTNLQVRHAGFEVAKALLDKASHRWEGWPPALTGLVLVILSGLGSSWINAAESISIVGTFANIALMVFLVLLWCGGWAFATRMINGGSARYGRHLFITGSAIILLDCWHILSITTAYAFSFSFLTRYSSLIEMVILAGMVLFHLTTINSQHPKRFIGITSAIAVLGISTMLVINYQRSGKLTDSLYMTYLLPPALRVSNDASVNRFIEEASTLKPELEKTRKQPVNKRKSLFSN
jgi:hypothetical protein